MRMAEDVFLHPDLAFSTEARHNGSEVNIWESVPFRKNCPLLQNPCFMGLSSGMCAFRKVKKFQLNIR